MHALYERSRGLAKRESQSANYTERGLALASFKEADVGAIHTDSLCQTFLRSADFGAGVSEHRGESFDEVLIACIRHVGHHAHARDYSPQTIVTHHLN